jgi:hypothetical protein
MPMINVDCLLRVMIYPQHSANRLSATMLRCM